MNHRDLASSLFLFALSGYILFASLGLGLGNLDNPGPGFVLFCAGLLLGCLALVSILLNALQKDRAGLLEPWKGCRWGHVLTASASLAVYTAVLTKLGYLVATLGLMLVLFGIGRMRPWVVVLSAFLSGALTYVFFRVFLQVPLPKGILPFL